MRSTHITATLFCAVAATLVATIAQADGKVCEKGFRDSTPAEKARMTAILEIAKRSLPPAPTGWQIGGYEVISVADNVCRDDEARPWSYGVSRTYNRVDDAAAREKIMRDAAAYMAAEQARMQPQIDALNAQMQKASARQIALVQKGDMAGAEKINYELEKLQNQYKKIVEGSDTEARIAAAGKASDHDRTMSISVRVNEMAIQRNPAATTFTPPTGAFAAQRWVQAGDAATNDEGHALILFGTWRTGPPTRWTAPARTGAVPTAAHVIALEITGDPTRIDPMLQAIKFQTLATAFTK